MSGHHGDVTPQELRDLLDQLIAGWENEVVEFKDANDNFSTSEIGKYVSALANETNLREAGAGWLVFGVDNRRRSVVGTSYRLDRERLDSLKVQIADGTEPSITFRELHVLDHPDGRVVLMEVPSAPRGLPISWHGHYYARAGESLVPLSLDKLDEIRQQTITTDWTAVAVPEATLTHLDPAAIARARQGFAERYSPRIDADDIAAWDDETFLEKARLTRGGQITRATLLLLGAETSTSLLNPHPGEMTWKLVGEQQAYEHFHLPFLLTATALAKRIRNVQIRLLPPDELIYREISKYDERSILEALYNCIAHQDYSRNSRIIVTESVDKVEFVSVGEFYDGTPGDYTLVERTPRKYRNAFLVEAMTELNLIDHLGYGIHRIVRDQVRRFLPLPDYDLDTDPREVKLTIPGAVIDEAYTKLLMVRTDLRLEDVLALDRVQKGLPITQSTAQHLRRAGLVEGRRPNLHVAAAVAEATGTKAEYIRTRAQDNAYYAKLLTDYLRQFRSATRQEVNDLLWSKLSDGLTDTQKAKKIANLLTSLRRAELIRNRGSRGQPRWELVE